MGKGEINISLIIPCYNYAQFLPETLESILNQTYKHWECILINDGSQDNTEQICLEYVEKDSRFKYIYQNNAGVSVARNKGLVAAKGKYIHFFDADDIMEFDKLRCQIEFLEENPHIDIIYSFPKIAKTNELGEITEIVDYDNNIILDGYGREDKIISHFVLYPPFTIIAAIIKKSCIKHQFDTRLSSAEDWKFFLELAIQNNYFFTLDKKDTYVIIRKHFVNKSSRNQLDNDKIVRDFIANSNLPDKYKKISFKRRLLHDIIFFRKTKNRLYFWKSVFVYIFYTKKSISDWKILLGENIFPNSYRLIKKIFNL